MVDFGVAVLGEGGDCNSIFSHCNNLLLQRAAPAKVGVSLSLDFHYPPIALFNVCGEPANSFPKLFVLGPELGDRFELFLEEEDIFIFGVDYFV